MGAIGVALIALLIAVVAHLLASRLHAGRVAGYGLSLSAGLAGVGLLGGLPASGGMANILASCLLFASWWFIFLNFVQTSQSSLRVHVLRELMRAGGAVDRSALMERYNNRALVALRLERLLSGGAVVERNGRYFVTSGALTFLARFFRALKIAILGRPSEFQHRPSP